MCPPGRRPSFPCRSPPTAFYKDLSRPAYYATATPSKVSGLLFSFSSLQMVATWGAVSWRGTASGSNRIELFTLSGIRLSPSPFRLRDHEPEAAHSAGSAGPHPVRAKVFLSLLLFASARCIRLGSYFTETAHPPLHRISPRRAQARPGRGPGKGRTARSSRPLRRGWETSLLLFFLLPPPSSLRTCCFGRGRYKWKTCARGSSIFSWVFLFFFLLSAHPIRGETLKGENRS